MMVQPSTPYRTPTLTLSPQAPQPQDRCLEYPGL